MDSNITATMDERSGGTTFTGKQARLHKAFRSLTVKDTVQTVEVTAAEKVFALPELLQLILIEVGDDIAGFKSLFVLQGVNTAFNDMINSSSKLKRIMFKQGTNKDSDTEPVLNPLFFDKSSNGIIHHATLTNWKPTYRTTIPTSQGYKRVLHCYIELTKDANQSIRNLPTKPKGSFRELKLCHSAKARGISTWIMRSDGCLGSVRFWLNTHVTVGHYLDLDVFNPR